MKIDDFATLIKERLRETGRSQYAAAVASGLPEDAIRSILNGHTPKLDRAAKVCAALGLELYIGPPRDALDKGSDVSERHPSPGVDHGDNTPPPWAQKLVATVENLSLRISSAELGVQIPQQARVREVDVTAGSEWMHVDEHILGYIIFDRTWLNQRGIDPDQSVIVSVYEESMAPTIPSGSKILVAYSLRQRRPGKIYVVWTRSSLLVRRVVRNPDGTWRLTCDNPGVDGEDWPKDCLVIGEVKWVSSML